MTNNGHNYRERIINKKISLTDGVQMKYGYGSQMEPVLIFNKNGKIIRKTWRTLDITTISSVLFQS